MSWESQVYNRRLPELLCYNALRGWVCALSSCSLIFTTPFSTNIPRWSKSQLNDATWAGKAKSTIEDYYSYYAIRGWVCAISSLSLIFTMPFSTNILRWSKLPLNDATLAGKAKSINRIPQLLCYKRAGVCLISSPSLIFTTPFSTNIRRWSRSTVIML